MIGIKKHRERKRPTLQKRSGVKRYTDYYKSTPRDVVVSTSKDNASRSVTQKRNRATRAVSLPSYIALFLIVVSIVWAGTLSGSTRVVMGEQNGLRTRDYYETVANDLMKKDVFNKTKVSFDTRTFKDNLLNAIPELEDVVVSVPIVGRNVVLGLTFVKPAYVYTVNATEYILGSDGVILSEASAASSAVIAPLKRLTDIAPLSVRVGQPVLLASDIVFIDKVFSDLGAANKPVKSVTLPEGAGELYVFLQNEQYSIKFSLIGDAQMQIGAYLATIQKLEAEGSKPLEYIDVRLGERVFVK